MLAIQEFCHWLLLSRDFSQLQSPQLFFSLTFCLLTNTSDGLALQSFWQEHCLCLEDLTILIVSVVLFVCQPLPMCYWSWRVANGTWFQFQGYGAMCECCHVWGALDSVLLLLSGTLTWQPLRQFVCSWCYCWTITSEYALCFLFAIVLYAHSD